MPIETRTRVTRAMLKGEPDKLFVFGDNLAHRGLGGQAVEMRGERNAVGIPTKIAPSMAPDAFFSDRNLKVAAAEIDKAVSQLAEHLRRGGTVVLPADGIGTGRAELAERAPQIRAYLDEQLASLAALGEAER